MSKKMLVLTSEVRTGMIWCVEDYLHCQVAMMQEEEENRTEEMTKSNYELLELLYVLKKGEVAVLEYVERKSMDTLLDTTSYVIDYYLEQISIPDGACSKAVYRRAAEMKCIQERLDRVILDKTEIAALEEVVAEYETKDLVEQIHDYVDRIWGVGKYEQV